MFHGRQDHVVTNFHVIQGLDKPIYLSIYYTIL